MKTKTRKAVVHVAPMSPAQQRAATQAMFDEFPAKITKQLEDLVLRALHARERFAAKMLTGNPGELERAVSWGEGVDDDINGVYAAEVLAAFKDGHEFIDVLRWMVESRLMFDARQQPGSSSLFSNAVVSMKAERAHRLAEKFRWWIAHYTELRGELEVL